MDRPTKDEVDAALYASDHPPEFPDWSPVGFTVLADEVRALREETKLLLWALTTLSRIEKLPAEWRSEASLTFSCMSMSTCADELEKLLKARYEDK